MGSDRVLCLCDNSASMWGQKIGNKEVLSFAEAKERYGQVATFLITPVKSEISTSIPRQLYNEAVSFRFWR